VFGSKKSVRICENKSVLSVVKKEGVITDLPVQSSAGKPAGRFAQIKIHKLTQIAFVVRPEYLIILSLQ
jgi:hypothetical protein